MVLYKCTNCEYMTERKSDYNKHLNRKIPCIPTGNVVILNNGKNGEFIKMNHSGSLVNHCRSQMNHYGSQNPLTPNKDDDDKSMDHECMYCGKVFTKKTNLTRHVKNYCRVLNNEMSQLKEHNEKLEEKTKELEAKIEKLSNTIVNNANTINNKTVHGDDKTVNNTTHTTNNITINSYGNESIGHLSNQYFKNLIGFPYSAVPKLIKDIHCNPDVPQNHNLKKTNKKDKYIQYYDGNDWKLENKKKMLDNLVEMTFTILENTVDREDTIEKKHLDRFTDFRDKFYEDKCGVRAKHMDEAEVMIINNSK